MPIVTDLEAQQYLGVAGSSKLTWIVNGVNDWAETYCGRSFAAATYTEAITIDPYQTEIQLAQAPLITLMSLQDSSNINVTTTATDNEAGIVVIAGSYWEDFPEIEHDSQLLTAIYQAGFSTMPDDLRLAVFSIIADRYNAGDSQIIQERLGDRSYRRSQDGFPGQALRILDAYKWED